VRCILRDLRHHPFEIAFVKLPECMLVTHLLVLRHTFALNDQGTQTQAILHCRYKPNVFACLTFMSFDTCGIHSIVHGKEHTITGSLLRGVVPLANSAKLSTTSRSFVTRLSNENNCITFMFDYPYRI
jgi:hypothetical protein